jgi:hypothetical protein
MPDPRDDEDDGPWWWVGQVMDAAAGVSVLLAVLFLLVRP